MTRRTGVIVGINRLDLTVDQADRIARQLGGMFPSVTIAVVPTASSLAFEYDDEETES